MTAPCDLVISGVTLPDGGTGTIRCAGGIIASAGPSAVADPAAVDGSGFIVLPQLVDAHVHLDKTLLGPVWYPHQAAASLRTRIASEVALLESDAVEPADVRAGRLVSQAVANGATALRSHVDVSSQLGLRRLRAVQKVRDAYADACDITLVAFPQEGVLASPGTAALLDAAVREGCDAVGGLDPQEFDGDRGGQLDVIFGIAGRRGCRIDVHVHESGQTGIDTLAAIADRTRVLGLGGRVCVSHCYALAQVDRRQAAQTADALADAGVGLVSSAPGEGRMPPLLLLADHGVAVAVASDNIRDSWWPYGKADPLERACTAGYLLGAHTDAALARVLTMVSSTPAALLGLAHGGLVAGASASFTLVRAASLAEAVVAQPAGRVVVRNGRVVAGGQHLPGLRPGHLRFIEL